VISFGLEATKCIMNVRFLEETLSLKFSLYIYINLYYI